ncbi:MAG TPA: phosphoenolpyruvate--protein phosphotransferase [Ignavibacteria bacterium]|nr:phosphoenolpyruvate--protein phosphotransferase [Ignavibacteria bacterium]HMR00226.1 phosphoenolpyruvate--protein phosphotransferase [Ignavibacteria bacterium]
MNNKPEKIFKGIAASKGISIGRPFVYRAEVPSYKVDISPAQIVSSDAEISDYENAVNQSVKELNKIFTLAKEKLDDKNLQIFEAQLSFLYDNFFHSKVKERIRSENKQAFVVFKEEIQILENAIVSSRDEYIRDRVNDIEDMKNRVLRNLLKGRLVSKITENSIVIARNLSPADTILFSNRNLLGIATDLGGINSHVALISRSLRIPAVVAMQDISVNISSEDSIIIDGYKGLVIRNPSMDTISSYEEQIIKNSELERRLEEIEKLPTETRDGKSVRLSTNLEFNNEVDYVVTHYGCDVGLYRTEHLFMEQGDFPSEEDQYRQYKFLAEHIYPKTVTIRTFDIGGDKILPDSQKELNPFLGWRGIRICLDKKETFLTQLRAILKASAGGNLKIMLPMISGIEEVKKTFQYLEEAKSQLREENIRFDEKIQVGVMIEIPSAVILADELAKMVDFFSIGTNDLVQYSLAVDRDSSLVCEMYEKFHPAVLRLIDMTVRSAAKNNIPVSVCGEMASDPYASLLLIGMGVTELSVVSTQYLQIKRLIRLVNYENSRKVAAKVLTMSTIEEVKTYIEECFNKNIGEQLEALN